jgi:hypothetical protein
MAGNLNTTKKKKKMVDSTTRMLDKWTTLINSDRPENGIQGSSFSAVV